MIKNKSFIKIILACLITLFFLTNIATAKTYFIETASNCLWEQRNDYNDWLGDVLENQGFPWDGYDVPLGCTAVALGIMMRTHQWPPSSQSIATHQDQIWTYGPIIHTVPSYKNENQKYDWENMPLGNSQSNSEIEKLLYHIAVSVKMNWGWFEDHWFGACPLERQGTQYNSGWFDDDWRYRTPTDYDGGVSMKEDVIESIKWGLPVPFWVGEHTAVYTGYNSDTDTFYINWGWGDDAHCDPPGSGNCENGWYGWPPTGGLYEFPDGETMGPRHTEVPYCAPEHWVFTKSGCSGKHHGTAKEPYSNLADAIDWIESEVDEGIVNLWTGTYTFDGVIDVPCELRPIEGDVVIEPSNFEWQDTPYGGLGLGFKVQTFTKEVNWNVKVDGLVFLGTDVSGTIPPNSIETIKIHPIGFGPIEITVTVGNVQKTYSAFLLGFLTLNIKEIEL